MIAHAHIHVAEGFKWILEEAFNVYSQYGEDGIIAGVARRYGLTNKVFVDVGAGDGIQWSNTRVLAEHGCTGLWLESNPDALKRARECAPQGVEVVDKMVRPYGPDSLDVILPQHRIPPEFDVLSLDVDGYEWHIWNCMMRFWPRIVLCEYDPGKDGPYTVCPHGDGNESYEDVQPAWQAVSNLAFAKGYTPICRTHTNLIALRRDVWYKALDTITEAPIPKPQE
jgi:hypothetical protein